MVLAERRLFGLLLVRIVLGYLNCRLWLLAMGLVLPDVVKQALSLVRGKKVSVRSAPDPEAASGLLLPAVFLVRFALHITE